MAVVGLPLMVIQMVVAIFMFSWLPGNLTYNLNYMVFVLVTWIGLLAMIIPLHARMQSTTEHAVST